MNSSTKTNVFIAVCSHTFEGWLTTMLAYTLHLKLTIVTSIHMFTNKIVHRFAYLRIYFLLDEYTVAIIQNGLTMQLLLPFRISACWWEWCMKLYHKASIDFLSSNCITGLHLGTVRGGICPPWKQDGPLGYVVCIVTYIILKRFMNHMMSHHSYLIKIKFLH